MKSIWKFGWVILGLACATAHAEGSWWLRTGASNVQFSESAELAIGGAVVPGASVSVKNTNALSFEAGYNLTPTWSLGLTVGVPPKTEVAGSGNAAQLGRLATPSFGPMVLSLQWSVIRNEKWNVYLGGGAARLIVTKTEDGELRGVKIDDAWGSAIQAGVEYQLSGDWGLFLDLKKIALKTSARGSVEALGGAPATAEVRLNPLVTTAGLVWRF